MWLPISLAHKFKCYERIRVIAKITNYDGGEYKLVKVGALLEIVGDWKEFLVGGLKEKELEVMRCHTCTGRPLGGEEFIRQVEFAVGRVISPLKRGPKGQWKKSKGEKV